MFWFLELEEELGLFRRNHFYDSFALPNSGGVLLDPTFSSSGLLTLRWLRFSFSCKYLHGGIRGFELLLMDSLNLASKGNGCRAI